ncbi:hypothetical protein IB269_16550 [Delftia sp. DLF01]|uniref:hypothetical protein n=1 Tax=Delftia sp. DLF01 TaxID=2769279 RepID=UPI0017817184|nr:hypothetical protein [Delftia sp. DLF01]MBD9583004.1 hypothetical protein [Delftia sp. DLF01]
MTAATVPAAKFAAQLAGLITGLPIGAENLSHEQVARAFLRVSLEAEKLGREYAAQALGQPIPVSTTTTEDHHGL